MLIKTFIILTLVFYLYAKCKDKGLGFLLWLSVLNTILSEILDYFNIAIYTNNNIYIFLHQLLWLLMIRKYARAVQTINIMIVFFVGFSLFTCLDMNKEFNFKVFLLGAVFYIVAFIFESYTHLKKDQLDFFISNNYILLFAPVLFFFGMSLLFNFESRTITKTILFHDFTLYDIVGYFVNVVYYSVINLFILKEKSTNG